MSLWLWTFWTYSFLGYLLERGYAIATHADRQARKCFLLLPMCPVYGLGALAVLALPESLSGSFWSLALWGGLAATAVEYAVHVLYDRLLGVRFWDYSQVRWNLRGRVCLPFSLAWSLLVAAGLPVIQAAIAPALAAVPPTATYAALLVFTADTVVSLQLRAGQEIPQCCLWEICGLRKKPGMGKRPCPASFCVRPVTVPAGGPPASAPRPHRPSPGPSPGGSHAAGPDKA
ncbi:MAG: putative ABC transporter permease [Dysosmobacter welbionis]